MLVMSPDEIRSLIAQSLPEARVDVQDLDGIGQHFQAVVVSERFAGLTLIKQHKLVYEAVQAQIDSGYLHALTLKTYTPEQWQKVSASA